jgi:hypothetical protein
MQEKGEVIMKISIALLSAILTLTACASAHSSNDAAEKAAVESAQIWLAEVDAGQYEASWNDAAEIFRAAVKKEQWPAVVGSVRKPLGNLKARKLLNSRYTESLPNAPAGKYVVLQFETAFESKKVVETVTPVLDQTGKWRVCGYFVK